MVLGGAGSCRSRAGRTWSYTCLRWPVRETVPSCGGRVRGGPAGLRDTSLPTRLGFALPLWESVLPAAGSCPSPCDLRPRWSGPERAGSAPPLLTGSPAARSARRCVRAEAALPPVWAATRASPRGDGAGLDSGPHGSALAAGSFAGPGREEWAMGREELELGVGPCRCGRVAPSLPDPGLRPRTEGGDLCGVPSEGGGRGPDVSRVSCDALYKQCSVFSLTSWEPETICRKYSNVRVMKVCDHTC